MARRIAGMVAAMTHGGWHGTTGKAGRPSPSRSACLAGAAEPVVAELLERRRMLSSSFNSTTGVLTVTSTSGNDTIYIYRTTANGIRVRENGVDSAWFPATGANPVNRIDVFGNGGADTITIGRTAAPGPGGTPGDVGVNKQTKLNGGDGNDTIDGGENNDTIKGDAGDDLLTAWEADDTLYGGNGYDTLDCGSENDVAYGGNGFGVNDDATTGFDSINGGTGNDSLFGEGGNDTITGDAGNDLMYGGDGDDTIDAFGNGSDTLDGGAGTDCGWWDLGTDSASNMEGRFP